MALKGWTLPQSPTGKSSLLPPPPWHYSGEIISADFTADPARVRKAIGSRFAAHVSQLGRRLVTLSVTLEETVEGFYPPSVARPPLHTRLFPSIGGTAPSVHEFQRAKVADFALGTVFRGSATLEFGQSEFNEIDALGPVSVQRGHVHSMAFSVVGGTVQPVGDAP